MPAPSDRDELPAGFTGPPEGSRPSRATAWAAVAAFAVTAPVYLATMNRTIGFIDRGELAAVATTWGVAHPTGYPLVTALGWAVTKLVPLRPVLVLNTFNALLVAASVSALTVLFADILGRLSGSLGPGARARLGLLGALSTAWTATWWQQANGFEVHGLQTLLVPLLLLAFLRWLDAECARADAPVMAPPRRPGVVFAVLLGLAVCNHLTVLLLAPALLTVTVVRLRAPRRLATTLLPLVPVFLVALLPYALLPWRSASGPRFDWGGTHTVSGLLFHVGAREFRGWMFSDPAVFARQASYLGWRLTWDLGVVGLLALVPGLFLLVRRSGWLAAWAVLIAGAGTLYACGYAIRDLDAYLLNTMVGFGVIVASGLLAAEERFGSRIAVLAGSCIALTSFSLHLAACDESRNTLVEDLVANQLGALPERAVLLTTQWDYGLSASYYFQEVEGLRRDVTVVSPDLLRRRWYLDELQRRDPDLVRHVAPEARRFREAVAPFERGRPIDRAAVGAAYRALLDSLVERAARERPVFATAGVDPGIAPNRLRVPYGLAFALRADSAYLAPPSYAIRWRPWPGHVDPYAATLHWIYGQSLASRAAYEARHQRLAQAERTLELARRFDPGIRPERVPPMALDGNQLVLQSARFFRDLQGQPAASP